MNKISELKKLAKKVKSSAPWEAGGVLITRSSGQAYGTDIIARVEKPPGKPRKERELLASYIAAANPDTILNLIEKLEYYQSSTEPSFKKY